MSDTATAPATEPYPADLDPSRVGGRMYVSRRRVTKMDAALAVSLMIILIAMVPSNLIVPGMTDLGRPGLIVGFLMFCWWVLARFTSHLSMVGPQPMRWAVLVYVVVMLLSYAAGFMRGLTSMESNGADRAILAICVFCGILLAAADGLPNWLRLLAVIRVLVICATAVSLIALAQFLFAFDITHYLTIPGLSPKGWAPGFEVRGGGIRVAGTATHYIELAAFLAMCMPFAIHFAIFAEDRRRKWLALLAPLILAAGVAATISRTGIFALGLMLVALVPVWTWRLRYNVAAVGVALVAGLALMNPGLVNTLVRLFDDPSSNPAFTVRAERYPLVFHYVAQTPWLGRGTGTWIAPQYQILDNQWLGTLVANGALGVAALAGLHIAGIVLGILALRRCTEPRDRHFCAALVATQLMAIGVAGTFDSLSFSTYTAVLALTLGLCGTVWRLTHPARTVRTSTTRWFLGSDRRTV